MDNERFLHDVRWLKKQVQSFDRSGREFLRSMPTMTEEAYEASTPQAEIEGTLECLLGDDLEPALRKMGELEDLLQRELATAAQGDSKPLSGGERAKLTAEERQRLRDAAREAGLPEDFGDLLCQLGDLLGFDKIREDLTVVAAEVASLNLSCFRTSDS
jgi:hypothetical protein